MKQELPANRWCAGSDKGPTAMSGKGDLDGLRRARSFGSSTAEPGFKATVAVFHRGRNPQTLRLYPARQSSKRRGCLDGAEYFFVEQPRTGRPHQSKVFDVAILQNHELDVTGPW